PERVGEPPGNDAGGVAGAEVALDVLLGGGDAGGVAALVVVVLAVFLALQYNWGGGQGNRSPGDTTGTTGAGTTGAGTAAAGAAGGKQTVQVGRTAWYAGFRIDFGMATYDPGAEQPVRVELKVGNRGREDADLLGITVPMSIRFGDRTTQGSYTGSRRVGARSDVEVGVAFPVKGPVNLADGVLTVGGDDRLTAQIPFRAGASAPPVVGPVQILAPATAATDGLTFKNVTCELRTDFLDAHQQVSAKDRAIGCAFDVSFSGSRYAGVGPDGLRLVMPDGSVRAPQRYPAFHLNNGEERRDELVEFVFGWPVTGPGGFALRVFDTDLRNPDRKDLPLTLP
ncbi:hypothetical protein, partial [Dactylosporangium sp. NPDC006015]|uniref:hypothetical protein n=1 Tax=Dactylosporangium sp. NPDC006015 TaxID=3154576 RepID=UPI0033B290D2